MPSDLPQFGRYRAEEIVGRGGMGVVYRARDPLLDRDVAVKTIALSGEDDEEERRSLLGRIVREIQAAGALSHPRIARVHDVGELDGELFIVMELCAGPSLEKLIEGGLEPEQARRIVADTAEALDYAHSAGVIHRDVKPANILTDAEGRAKLVDFGIAKTLAGSKLTRTGMMVGTPEYMAPEQIEGEDATPASDQYALAATAYEALTGRVPFDAETIPALLTKILSENPPPAREAPRNVAAALQRGLSKAPEKRFPDCAAFAEALRAEPSDAVAAGPRKRAFPVAAAAAGFAAVLALGAAFWFRPSSETREPESPAAAAEAPVAEAPAARERPEPEPAPEPTRTIPPRPAPQPTAQPKTAPARAEPEAEAARPAPARLVAAGPIVELVWRGALPPDGLLTIAGGAPDSGELSAPLPAVPVRVEISPPDAVEVVEQPRQANGWSRLQVRNRGRARRLLLIRYQALQPESDR